MVRCIVKQNDSLVSPVRVQLVEVGAQLNQNVEHCFAIVPSFVDSVKELAFAVDTSNDVDRGECLGMSHYVPLALDEPAY